MYIHGEACMCIFVKFHCKCVKKFSVGQLFVVQVEVITLKLNITVTVMLSPSKTLSLKVRIHFLLMCRTFVVPFLFNVILAVLLCV
jgi:hypothetical protein